MEKNVETILRGAEALAGYEAVKLVPENILAGKWNRPIVGVVVLGAGLMTKQEDMIAVGLGAAVSGILSAFGI